MNINRTREFYAELTKEDLCDCTYCQHYAKEIRAAYPAVSAYLDHLGIDIEKPFEAIPFEEGDGALYYAGVQYIVLGSQDDFSETSVGDVKVFLADSHPTTDITEDHFVIEIAPIRLRRKGERRL